MSMLDDIKTYLGIPLAVDCFDRTLVLHLNTVIFLTETISRFTYKKDIDETTEWQDVFRDTVSTVPAIKSYICLKVRLLFDPPNNSFLTTTIEHTLTELEFKINMYCDSWLDKEEE